MLQHNQEQNDWCASDGTITGEFDISPVTGDVVKYKSSDDVISDLIKSDNEIQ